MGFFTAAAMAASLAPAAAMPATAPLEKASKWDGMAKVLPRFRTRRTLRNVYHELCFHKRAWLHAYMY